MTVKEKNKSFLIPYPKNGEDPFTYEKGDKPYFIWLTNREMDCSLLGNEEILDLSGKCYEGEIRLRQFDMGYTNLCQFERLFLLYVGEKSYEENKDFTGDLMYCKDDIEDEELIADTLLFATVGGMRHTAAWDQIKEVLGKKPGEDTFSIADARKMIEYKRSYNERVYACVGVRTVEEHFWH